MPSKPAAGSKQLLPKSKLALRPTKHKQPQEPNLPAVVKAVKAKKAVERPKPEAEGEPSVAVRSYKPEAVVIAEEELELDLPGKLNIVDLIDLVGKYLNLDYMYDPDKVKGEVTLKLQGPVKVKELYPMLESVLKFRGFVMARKDNLITIVPASEVLNIDPASHYKAFIES